ncbi:MAG: FKBP-type peptidyl-prolyl cis-trans isomerase [Syntrophorhabdaceae bacterium]|nr:FKBP-type peptidyl-prolyl cis-trans isomerase [Syntrophorhabdaceae bacterium]
MNLFSVRRRFVLVFIVVFLTIFVMMTVPVFAQSTSGPSLSREKAGYALGVSIGRNVKNLGIDIDPDMIVRGIRDTVRGQSTMSDQEVKTALDIYEKELVGKLSDKNKRDGEAFLGENKQRRSVVTLPSGLQYMVLREGKGPTPKMDDLVTIHYKARMIDGMEFESSYWNNKPADIAVNKAIKGWTEALTKMPVGSIWRLYIPSQLAYGEAGAGTMIGPNAVIICDLELLAVR